MPVHVLMSRDRARTGVRRGDITMMMRTQFPALLCLLTVISNAEDPCKGVPTVNPDQLTIIRGSPGTHGALGQKGEPGRPGNTGDQGRQGEPGKIGPPGEKGDKGLLGQPGTQGTPGGKGDIGTQGLHGQKGNKGTSCPPDSLAARNCKDHAKSPALSSRYTIYPDGKKPLRVLCDMDTDGGGWIIFQRRWDGSVDFFRDWKSYKTGFGNLMTEFWLGNDNLHLLTSSGKWELRIDLQDYNNTKQYIKYSSIKVLGESDKYKLVLGDFKDGNALDNMKYHKDMSFTTLDQDNDKRSSANCAQQFKGGWWYNECYHANLNGLYYLEPDTSNLGINMKTETDHQYSYKCTEMKIRPI